MATKVKPTRLQITGTPQAGQVPIYVNSDCFCWGSSGVGGPSSSCDGDLAIFCGTCGDCIVDSGEKLCDYAKCCDIPTDNCQLANGCGYQTTSCMVNDFSSPSCSTYPTTEAVCCYVGQKISGAYIYKGTVNAYEDLPTTGLTAGDVYNVTTAHTTSPEFPAGANLAWTGSDWDVLGGLTDLSGKQDKLTAGNGIDIDVSNKISTTYIYGESSTAAATVQKEVSIPSITELNVGQVIIVKPTVTSTVASSTLKLNSFPAYKMLYNGAEITTSTDSIVWSANVPSMFYLDEVSGTKYWRFLGHGLDSNSTYTLNQLLDAGRYKAGTGTYAITRYSLCMMKADGTWEKITATNANYSTATTKNVNTNGFVLNQIKYYNTTTAVAGGAFVATNTFASQAATVTLAYSFNCGTAPGWSLGDPIYIVGTIGADGLFYLDTTARWTTTLPSTKDGKLYIRIGTALAADNSTASFLQDRPIFYYDNGIKEYVGGYNKQDKSAMVTTLTGADDSHYPTAKAVADAIQCSGGGDMTKAVYDPNNHNADAFDYCNFTNTPTIPTDNCQLSNSCGYTTCTGTLVSSDIACINGCCLTNGGDICIQGGVTSVNGQTGAVCLTIPTDNCQLANGCGYTTCTGTLSTCSDITTALGYTPYSAANPCGYTTCTGTLQACDIANLAQCCDIPTDNCQLANGCGYTTCTGTLSTCSDITTALGFTPYSAANPCGYTTCTGTLSSCADVISALGYTPYNSSNPSGYTSCTGTLNGGDLKTVNGCCLVGSGDICIQSGGIINDTTCTTSCIEAEWAGSPGEFCCIVTRCSTTLYFVKK